MVNRNSPETETSAAKHTPHSYTPPSSLSSSSLLPCWTDFKLSPQECVCMCAAVYVCACLVGLCLWCWAVQGGLSVYYSHWTMTPISSSISSYKSENSSSTMCLSDLVLSPSHRLRWHWNHKKNLHMTWDWSMKGTAYWQMCMKGHTQEFSLKCFCASFRLWRCCRYPVHSNSI